MSAELYVQRAKKKFDIIFLDPPFPYQFKWELVAGIAASPLAAPGTAILLHRPRQDYQKEEIALLTKQDSREYGRSVVDFFCVKKQEEA